MKKAIISFVVGFIVASIPLLSVHLAIVLHNSFGIINFPTVYGLFAFMGLWGVIVADVLFYIIAGILIALISPPRKIIVALLVGLIVPIVFQHFSVLGLNLVNYINGIIWYIPSVLIGLWLGSFLKKSPTAITN